MSGRHPFSKSTSGLLLEHLRRIVDEKRMLPAEMLKADQPGELGVGEAEEEVDSCQYMEDRSV